MWRKLTSVDICCLAVINGRTAAIANLFSQIAILLCYYSTSGCAITTIVSDYLCRLTDGPFFFFWIIISGIDCTVFCSDSIFSQPRMAQINGPLVNLASFSIPPTIIILLLFALLFCVRLTHPVWSQSTKVWIIRQLLIYIINIRGRRGIPRYGLDHIIFNLSHPTWSLNNNIQQTPHNLY